MKKIAVAFSVVIGIIILSIAILGLYMRNQMKELRPIGTNRINDTTFVVKGRIGDMFLVGKPPCYVAVDAADNSKEVANGLRALSINPDLVKAVFLTHSDADHVAGIPLFKNATVYLAQKETLVLSGAVPRHFLFLTHKNSLPVSRYTTLNDCDSVFVDGIRVIAIATPGHTIGSMCYRIGSMLFTGDLCMLRNGAVEPMLDIFTEDRATDSLSIRKVALLPEINFVATAHAGVTTDMQAAFSRWR